LCVVCHKYHWWALISYNCKIFITVLNCLKQYNQFRHQSTFLRSELDVNIKTVPNLSQNETIGGWVIDHSVHFVIYFTCKKLWKKYICRRCCHSLFYRSHRLLRLGTVVKVQNYGRFRHTIPLLWMNTWVHEVAESQRSSMIVVHGEIIRFLSVPQLQSDNPTDAENRSKFPAFCNVLSRS